MQGHAFAGKGKQNHGQPELRGGEAANTFRDHMRLVWYSWHPELVPWHKESEGLGLDSLLILWILC